MLRQFKPKRIVEIGSGYSSALMMDVNEHFLNHKMSLTFVEPYPKLLKSLMKPDDKKRYKIIGQNLSEVRSSVFKKLEAGDILFVDSTHVSKVGSDVNQIFFDILPLLKKGVIIHVHDIFYPFEYPLQWIEETRAWTEGYVVRAFLHNNKEYEIILFNHFLNVHHKKELKKLLPNTSKNAGSGIWLRKR
jgi:predicted O-methyltransferase YrrM